jgi:hypothetical protein
MELARGGRERGWWQDAPFNPALKTLIGMEGSAETVSEFQILTIPGLVQTREYAEAICAAFYPGDPDRRESVVAARMRRQEILRRESPPRTKIVLDEAALRRIVGNGMIMKNQLQHLMRLNEEAIAEVRVIPFSAGAHVGMDSGFTILTFALPLLSAAAAPTTSAVVYVPSIGTSRVVVRFMGESMEHKMLEALAWKSARSCTGGNCVQVAPAGRMVAIRDSKNPGGAILTYSPDEWTAFVEGVKNEDFDDVARGLQITRVRLADPRFSCGCSVDPDRVDVPDAV